LDPRNVMKTCTVCREAKDLVDFPPDKRNNDGRSSLCRTCDGKVKREWQARNPEKVKAGHRRRYQRHHDEIRAQQVDSRLRHRYGITLEEYEEMLERQDGRCAICRRPPPEGKRLHVDHNHETGEVRGLLCSWCNTRLIALENREWFEAAQSYLCAIRSM
jgi:DNA-binding transcriptional MerR regulator